MNDIVKLAILALVSLWVVLTFYLVIEGYQL
jgi:hypothetical protein